MTTLRHTNMCRILILFLFTIVNTSGQNIKEKSSEDPKNQVHFVNEKTYQEYHDRDYGKANTMHYAV